MGLNPIPRRDHSMAYPANGRCARGSILRPSSA